MPTETEYLNKEALRTPGRAFVDSNLWQRLEARLHPVSGDRAAKVMTDIMRGLKRRSPEAFADVTSGKLNDVLRALDKMGWRPREGEAMPASVDDARKAMREFLHGGRRLARRDFAARTINMGLPGLAIGGGLGWLTSADNRKQRRDEQRRQEESAQAFDAHMASLGKTAALTKAGSDSFGERLWAALRGIGAYGRESDAPSYSPFGMQPGVAAALIPLLGAAAVGGGYTAVQRQQEKRRDAAVASRRRELERQFALLMQGGDTKLAQHLESRAAEFSGETKAASVPRGAATAALVTAMLTLAAVGGKAGWDRRKATDADLKRRKAVHRYLDRQRMTPRGIEIVLNDDDVNMLPNSRVVPMRLSDAGRSRQPQRSRDAAFDLTSLV